MRNQISKETFLSDPQWSCKSRVNPESATSILLQQTPKPLKRCESALSIRNRNTDKMDGDLEQRYQSLEENYRKLFKQANKKDEVFKRNENQLCNLKEKHQRNLMQIQKLRGMLGFLDKKDQCIQININEIRLSDEESKKGYEKIKEKKQISEKIKEKYLQSQQKFNRYDQQKSNYEHLFVSQGGKNDKQVTYVDQSQCQSQNEEKRINFKKINLARNNRINENIAYSKNKCDQEDQHRRPQTADKYKSTKRQTKSKNLSFLADPKILQELSKCSYQKQKRQTVNYYQNVKSQCNLLASTNYSSNLKNKSSTNGFYHTVNTTMKSPVSKICKQNRTGLMNNILKKSKISNIGGDLLKKANKQRKECENYDKINDFSMKRFTSLGKQQKEGYKDKYQFKPNFPLYA